MAASDAVPVPRKNTAFRVYFTILDADGDLVTGATGLDSEISKDGGTFADCTNEATEIATASGCYYLELTSTEMNADGVVVIVKTTTVGAKTTVLVFYPEELGDIRVNAGQVGGTNQTAGDLAAMITAVDDFVDTEVAAIKAKTDNLPTDPADASDIAASLSTITGYIDTEVAAILAAVDTEVAAIKAKTDNLPSDPADESSVQAAIAAVQSDTNDIQARLPAALTGAGNIKSDPQAIGGSANAAARLALAAANMIPGTVDTGGITPTTTTFDADDITEATADHYNGRLLLWTSGALLGQVTDVSDYALVSGRGRFTVTALTEAPADNDTFLLV